MNRSADRRPERAKSHVAAKLMAAHTASRLRAGMGPIGATGCVGMVNAA